MGILNVPDTMLACQIVEFNKPYKINRVPTPKYLAPHDILLKVAVASLCRTDLQALAGNIRMRLPCTASHEAAGTVAAVGGSVTDFQPGDRVMGGLVRGICGECDDCRGPESSWQYCAKQDAGLGVGRDGAFAEYVVVDARWSVKLPDVMSFEMAAPLACAGATIWRALLQTELVAGQWLAIIGSGGGLGHLGIQFAKALGLRVVGVDARDEGLKLSRDCGAEVVVDVRRGTREVVRAVRSATDGKGVHATVNVSDATSAVATACAVTRAHGVVMQIAQPSQITFSYLEPIVRNITIRGSMICSPSDAKSMVEISTKHRIAVNTTSFHGIREIPNLMELAQAGKLVGKGIVIIDQDQIDKQRLFRSEKL